MAPSRSSSRAAWVLGALAVALAAGTAALARPGVQDAAATPAAAAAASYRELPPAGQNSWLGQWRTLKGDVTFRSAGTLIAGYTVGFTLQITGTLDSPTVTVGNVRPQRGHVLRGTFDEVKRGGATPYNSGTIKLVLSEAGHTFIGTYEEKGSPNVHHPLPGTCVAGECLLNGSLVAIRSVSNGCGGGGWNAFTHVQNLLANKHTYPTGVKGDARTFTVDFKDACDLHDAGYAGAIVIDKLNGNNLIDYRGYHRSAVDDKFLMDMHLLCNTAIPAHSGRAREFCGNLGSKGTIGANNLYEFVRSHGWLFYDYDLVDPGVDKTGPREKV